MHRKEHEALRKLREAILDDVAEDMAFIDEMTDEHVAVIREWNRVAAAGVHLDPITDADIEARFE